MSVCQRFVSVTSVSSWVKEALRGASLACERWKDLLIWAGGILNKYCGQLISGGSPA
jgi:hypothetical protein